MKFCMVLPTDSPGHSFSIQFHLDQSGPDLEIPCFAMWNEGLLNNWPVSMGFPNPDHSDPDLTVLKQTGPRVEKIREVL